MSTPSRLRADAARNVEQILATAETTLAQRPETTMQEIATASGLGRATVYRHFPTREELLDALRERALDEAERALAGALLDEGSAPEALERAVAALLSVGRRYSSLVSQIALHPELLVGRPGLAQPLGSVIVRGRQAGELDAGLSPPFVIGALAGLLVAAVRGQAKDRLAPEDAAAVVTRTLLHGIAAQDNDPTA